ncbi:S8 family serine peptidase [Pedomonas sp. V897]|uniref:S8 family serine peptidase n=1 Tax=Pedomonas sp. V897 TaxID=3446482 RepID=UPI003EDEEEC0
MDVMLVAKDGQVSGLAEELGRRGYKIVYRAEEIGYLRVEVPPQQVLSLVSHPTVLAAGLGHFRYTALSQDKSPAARDETQPHQMTLSDFIRLTQKDPVYHAIEEMHVSALRVENSLYDGRGVKIAIIENIPDPLAPELADAYDLDGRRIKKIENIYAFADLGPNSLSDKNFRASGWVKLQTHATDRQQSINLNGRSVRMPGVGPFEVGFLDESDFVLYGKDLNFDQNPSSKPRTFAVARRPSGDCVWVDTNQDDDLTDEQCYLPYSKDGKGGFFRDAAGDPVGARFYISTTFREEWVHIAVPNDHTHAVASLAAGQPVLAPNLGSAAPGAQILPIAVDTSLSTLIEAAIFAARQESVDIIVNMLAANLALAPDNAIDAVIMDRIAQHYGKIVIGGGGNFAHKIGQIGSNGRGANVLSIGQYVGARSWEALNGGHYEGGPAYATSAGPALDGRLKPDVLGVGYVVTPLPRYVRGAADNACPTFVATNNFTCFSGTSAATPTATGAVAALISAARQKKLKFTPLDIVQAVRATAHLSNGVSTHVQGRGLIDVYAAWQYLNRLVENRAAQVKIDVMAPVKTGLVSAGLQADKGPGLYEREGWSPGDEGGRVIKLRRTTGADRPLRFSARILGDYQHTFSGPKELVLPLNRDVPVAIRIRPKQAGVHAAILRIADPETGLVAEDIALTVVAAIDLASVQGEGLSLDVTLHNPHAVNLYVRVPPETAALKLSHTGGLGMGVVFDGPLGQRGGPVYSKGTMVGASAEVVADRYEQILHQPTPGVWEISFLNYYIYDTDRMGPLPFRVNISTLGQADLERVAEARGGVDISGGVSPSGFHTRIIQTAWKQGVLDLAQERLPAVIPIHIPEGFQRIEVSAAVNNLMTASASSPSEIAVLVALLQCDGASCSYREGIAGSNTSTLLFSPQTEVQWYAVIDGVGSDSKWAKIAYNIFVDGEERSEGAKKSLTSSGNTLCQSSATELPHGYRLIEVKELYSDAYLQGEYGTDMLTGEHRLYGRTIVPLARLCEAPRGGHTATVR